MDKTLLRNPSPAGAAGLVAPRPMRLLIAEDNRANQMILQAYLGVLRLDMVFAENGREALHYWRLFAPDLIFMDISMPEMTGDAAARLLRAAEAAGQQPEGGPSVTPIVALSAHGAAHQSIGPEFNAHLRKPFVRERLIELLALYCPEGALFQEKP